MSEQKMQTYDLKAVGLFFNPSNDVADTSRKETLAHAIDQLHYLHETTENPEVKRLLTIAITIAITVAITEAHKCGR